MFIINKIQGNSGEGPAVFSKKALQHNHEYGAFKNAHKAPEKHQQQEDAIKMDQIKSIFDEITEKEKFAVSN